jgi:hypothetical protein
MRDYLLACSQNMGGKRLIIIGDLDRVAPPNWLTESLYRMESIPRHLQKKKRIVEDPPVGSMILSCVSGLLAGLLSRSTGSMASECLRQK